MSVHRSERSSGGSNRQPTAANAGPAPQRQAQFSACTDPIRATQMALTPAWNWETLAVGSAPWRAAWEDLGTWVQWYTERYELWQSMPVCWYLHSRLVEELRALRFYHAEVFATKAPGGDQVHSSSPDPCARAYWEWMTTRREWERVVLGHAVREQGECSGLSHASPRGGTVEGRADHLLRMSSGLIAMLDTTVLEHRRQ